MGGVVKIIKTRIIVTPRKRCLELESPELTFSIRNPKNYD
jgi:hypothetical protein